MLKKRLIPVLIYNDGKLVQSINFKHPMAIGNALTKISFFNKWSVDEIILLDVARERKNREKFYQVISNLSKKCFVPLSVGGWIQDLNEIEFLLNIGADKIITNTQSFENHKFLKEAAIKFGSQSIVVSIDAKYLNDQYFVFIDRGRKKTNVNPVDWAIKCEKLGAGEIFLTSIDNDGSRKGYDLKLMSLVTKKIDIPVIGFGGVWEWQHLVDGVTIGGLEGLGVGNVFHFKEHSTKDAKKYLRNKNIDIRENEYFNIQDKYIQSYKDVL